MAPIGRLITAMVTPFDSDGQVDFAQAKALALALLESGSDGLVLSGTTGESPTLTSQEKLKLFSEIKSAVGDRGSVIAGVGTNDTAASIELARGADLLIHDAQFTPEELKSKEGWGHSSWEQAVAVAEQAGVKRLALTHHDPDHDDDFILKMEEACKKQFANSFFAREMSEIEI